jgi:hypothetical protein
MRSASLHAFFASLSSPFFSWHWHSLKHIYTMTATSVFKKPVLRIRIHVFLGLLDPDPLVRGMDPDPAPDPSIIKHK